MSMDSLKTMISTIPSLSSLLDLSAHTQGGEKDWKEIGQNVKTY